MLVFVLVCSVVSMYPGRLCVETDGMRSERYVRLKRYINTLGSSGHPFMALVPFSLAQWHSASPTMMSITKLVDLSQAHCYSLAGRLCYEGYCSSALSWSCVKARPSHLIV